MKKQNQLRAMYVIFFVWFITANLIYANSPFDFSRDECKSVVLLAQETKEGNSQSLPPPPAAETTKTTIDTGDEEVEMKAWIPTGETSQVKEDKGIAQLDDEIFNQLVTLDFKDADLQNVIRLIAAKTNLNIVMREKEVRGTVTVHLENVKLGVALNSILKSNDLAYIKEEDGILRIVPLKLVQPGILEKKIVRVPLRWMDAKNVAKTLSDLYEQEKTQETNAHIAADPVSNSIMLRGTPIFIEELQNIIAQLDVPDKQVMIEARMVDISESAGRDLGVTWSLYRHDKSGASPGPNGRTTEVLNPDGSIDTEGTNEYAIDNLGMSSLYNDAAALTYAYGEDITIFGKDFKLGTLLQALESRGLATTLHNPKVITLNNIPANIELTTQNPYVEAVQGPSGQFVSNQVKFKDSGVKLSVTPNITNNGYIRMSITPIQDIMTGTSYGIPVINARSATTNVIVKDEDTVAIGGLRQLTASNSLAGVPWFHRIPLFGWLFKGTTDRQEKIENMLFVTPHILRDPTLSTEDQIKYDKIDYNWDLPDYFYDEIKVRDKPKPKDAL